MQTAAACMMCMVGMLGMATNLLAAEKDKPGAQDHPVLSRYEGSVLHNTGVMGFEQVELPLARFELTPSGLRPTKSLKVEGKVLNYRYFAPANRSDLEVFRNYQAALAASGFVVLFACDEPARCQSDRLGRFAADWTDRPSSFSGSGGLKRMEENSNFPPRFLVAQLKRPQGDVFVTLTTQPPSSIEKDKGVGGPYFLQVIEAQQMQTGAVTVDAGALQKGLASDGKVALYGVFFDTGSASIQPTSRPQLDEMSKSLQTQASLKVFVVGHTDNVGDIQNNLALSQKRAEAVAAWLVQNGKVDAKRISARGVGNFSPVASNTAEPGRSRNRRVELVVQ